MILLDTCVIIFDALAPEQLSKRACAELDKGRERGMLACSDISLWEIAMLMKKERIKPAMPPRNLLADVIAANRLKVLPISPEIAWLANYNPEFTHGDPADRIIAATALQYKAPLLTIDKVLRGIKGISTIW
jgi:PIN domain nuclease of toxin-antitoxin system